MRAKTIGSALLLVPVFFALALAGRAQMPKRDYLTEIEANKIRDAETPSERIKLFLTFAGERLKEFQHELSRPTASPRRAEILNGLLNGYSGCIDDAADRVEEARERQQDIHDGLKEMNVRARQFLAELKKLEPGGPELATYKDTLDDALEATQDALDHAEKASKEIPTAPVRRRP